MEESDASEKKKDCHFIDHKLHIETYGSCNSVLKTRDMAKWYLTYERKNKKSRSISAHFLGVVGVLYPCTSIILSFRATVC